MRRRDRILCKLVSFRNLDPNRYRSKTENDKGDNAFELQIKISLNRIRMGMTTK